MSTHATAPTLDRRAALRELGGAAILVLIACVLLMTATPVTARPLASGGPAAGPAPRSEQPVQPVVLAQDDGLTLVGRISALRGRPAPGLRDLTHEAAARLAPLPERNVYFRGATCRWPWRFGSPVLLTFTLPKAVFAQTRLPLYRLEGDTWRLLERRAVVGAVNTTATATLARPGRYAVCLTRAWRAVDQDGYRLVVYAKPYVTTDLEEPAVLASGATNDPAVIQAVVDATGQSEESARKTLVSYDSSQDPVAVLRLTHGTALVRNWSGTSTVGRWFAPSDGGLLPSPDTSRAIYALPDGNLAIDATLHLVKPGTDLIAGICADMTAQPGYGPWATGGGGQFFGPLVSTYPPPAYDRQRTVILSELRWEESELEAIAW